MTDDEIAEEKGLIAYRLGRVEKAVDNINQQSIDRDKEIITELRNISTLGGQVALNTAAIEGLKESRRNMYKVIATVALTVFAVAVEMLFNLI